MNGEGQWTYRCSLCSQYKTKEHFHSDKSKPPFEIAYNCKECRKESKTREPILHDWEYNEGRRVLMILGYDLNQDIHKQFKEKIYNKYYVVF